MAASSRGGAALGAAVAVLLGGLLFVGGCREEAGSPGLSSRGDDGARAPERLDYLVRVGDTALSEERFVEGIPEEFRGLLTLEEKRGYLDRWVDTELLYEAAKDRGVLDDPDLQQRLEQQRREYVANYLLQKVLNGNRSTEVKRRALFVLSQFEEPQAQTLLLESARNGNPELRQEAIRSIGIGGRDDTLAALSEIYRGGDEAIREAVLEAWMISDREQEIFEVAMNASSSEEAERAIQLLGVMDARESLQRLRQAGKGSSGLVQAFAIADDLDSLKAMANDASDPAVQIEAVQAIGIIDNDSARVALQQIYRDTRSAEVREAALQGMLIADDEAGVLKLYQGSNDPAEKQQLLRTLTMIGGDAALEAIDAALEGRSP